MRWVEKDSERMEPMMATLWPVVLTALLTSCGVSAFLVLTQRWHGWLSHDHDLDGVQKIHTSPVPRVGGVAIAAGLVAAALVGEFLHFEHSSKVLSLLLCAIPAFAAGLIEDLTKRVSVSVRLLASAASGALAVWLLDAYLTRLNTPGLDWLIGFAPVAMVFTSFAVSGVTNSVNIIDGLNGLASGSVAIMLAGLGTIAWMQQDTLVMTLCLMGVSTALGFMVLNFPFGKIFMGDGGAYLMGFWLAECAVLLLARNSDVSTWSVLLVCIYPVWETGFSMYRRNIVRKVSSGKPDMVHWHHLVMRRIFGLWFGPQRASWLKHAATSGAAWLMTALCGIIGVLSIAHEFWAVFGFCLFLIMYQGVYWSIVRACQPAQVQNVPEMQVG
jgi:UDP-N-acetylmuramyl pentapeptide phosphotransferase/UDP-N-acetylglucosamine-1-phosphate transferase